MTRLTTPKPGTGITYSINGDSYPFTIQEVSPSGHRFWATRDEFRAKPGANEPYSEAAKVGVFVPKSDRKRELFTRRRDGTYMPKGKPYVLVYEGREYRLDPSF